MLRSSLLSTYVFFEGHTEIKKTQLLHGWTWATEAAYNASWIWTAYHTENYYQLKAKWTWQSGFREYFHVLPSSHTRSCIFRILIFNVNIFFQILIHWQWCLQFAQMCLIMQVDILQFHRQVFPLSAAYVRNMFLSVHTHLEPGLYPLTLLWKVGWP